jgi:hypothetical protein
MGEVSALYFMTSVRALLRGKGPRSTVGQLPAFCSEHVSALHCVSFACILQWAIVRALLCGKVLRFTLGQVSAFYCGASSRALL